MAGLSVAIMAHPRRQAWIPALLDELGDVPVAWDRFGSRWDTGRRALLAHDPQATHHLIVQDDAIPCDRLLAAATDAAEHAGEHPLGLYMGSTQMGQIGARRQEAIDEARRVGSPWIELEGPWWAVAFVVAVPQIPDLVAWGDMNETGARPIANFDRRISRWYEQVGLKCFYTVPCLVDHRPVAENPSLIPGRGADRRACYFVADHSTLEIDWSRPPIPVPEPIRRKGRTNMAKVQRIYDRDERGRAFVTEVRRRVIAEKNVNVEGPNGVPRRIRAGKPVPFHLTDAYHEAVGEVTKRSDELAKMKVADLQKLAESRGLKKTGKKAELVARLERGDA